MICPEFFVVARFSGLKLAMLVHTLTGTSLERSDVLKWNCLLLSSLHNFVKNYQSTLLEYTFLDPLAVAMQYFALRN